MFANIPQELRDLTQWVCWRLEFEPPMLKPTKVPYTPRPNSGRADVTKPATWGTFQEAVGAPIILKKDEWVAPKTPVGQTGFSGIGFVFSPNDEYTGIDCDDTHGDDELLDRQKQLYLKLNSYTEYSPSGNGIHIIVKGKVPTGRRRNFIELYPQARFFTMTGNVFNNAPIAERQEVLDWLYKEMKGDVKEFVVQADPVQNEDDQIVIDRAKNAVNGLKFVELWEGRWQGQYVSQSEADFALTDIIAFYTKHIPQIMRLFRQSALGQRDKAKRDKYLMYMIEKSFDRTLPPIDFDFMAKTALGEFHNQMNEVNAATGDNQAAIAPGKRPSTEATTAAATDQGKLDTTPTGAGIISNNSAGVNPFPPGLLGEIAQFFYDAAPRPSQEIAFAGAIGFLAGVAGRAYNTHTGTGLNQYILMLAQTGIGKDAVASGTSKLTNAMLPVVPSINDFRGPGQLVSSAGLIKWIERTPTKCVFSILGEFGQLLKQMVAPNANTHLIGLRKTILELFSKSGGHETFDPMAYSDKEKNTAAIKSPSLTIFGESVPEAFYEALDDTMIMDGLMPRFMVFENKSKRAYFNERASSVQVPVSLLAQMVDLSAYALGVMRRDAVHVVQCTEKADKIFKEIDVNTTDNINDINSPVTRELWNRVHLKAIKLASLLAVGKNYLNPVVDIEEANWAIDICVGQARHLIAKFESGLIGSTQSTGESRQLTEVCKAINDFLANPTKYVETYKGRIDMIANGVFTENAIQRRVVALACFRHDRMGAKFAMKRAISTLLEADDLREIPQSQMQATYGCKPRAFVIANPNTFTKDLFN